MRTEVPQGTVTGPITVKTPGGTATSAQSFGNNAPSVRDIAVSVNEDTTKFFSASEFDASFSDPDAGDTLQSVTIVSLPANGRLGIRGVAVSVG